MEYRLYKLCDSGYELISKSSVIPEKISDEMRLELFDPNTGSTIILTE